MSAGIASAMFRAECKHQSIPTQADVEEAVEQFGFFPRSFYTPLRLSAQILLIPLHRSTDL